MSFNQNRGGTGILNSSYNHKKNTPEWWLQAMYEGLLLYEIMGGLQFTFMLVDLNKV